ncbi:major outer membrane protein [Campylobacter estrildidarum]|uniref:Pyruvate ferredoxin oxidoreductase n=1 Tax=Campylobacter estrildidarum TaxID=2510189 RepID=A0A4U7BLZ0_9BACT|nr:major outer membrane protein [Campylobacter estrildidarum]TKX29896.1 pyruvate ferredoxin oxidoreductase [Campylobacter estrildidarum]
MVRLFIVFILIGGFSFSNATFLDNTFKNIEVSGTMRYRYEMNKNKKFNKKYQKHNVINQMQITIK